MTEISKTTLRFILDRAVEKEMEDALSWAQMYEVNFQYPWTSKTPYMVASLVYLYETAHEQLNNIGKALCETIDEYNEDEAQNVMTRFKFPPISMYTVVKEWHKNDEIPHLFNVEFIGRDYELLHTAASRDDMDMVHWLIDHNIYVDTRDSSGKTALHVAAAAGKMQITRCLLNSGASIFSLDNDHQTPLQASLKYYKFEIAEFLKPNLFCNLRLSDGETLLMRLIRDGLTPQVKYMLRYADYKMLNYAEQNVLHVCAQSKQATVMGALLRERIPPELINAKDAFNRTPLYMAMHNNHTIIVEQLLLAGAAITPELRSMVTNQEISDLIKQYDTARASNNQPPAFNGN